MSITVNALQAIPAFHALPLTTLQQMVEVSQFVIRGRGECFYLQGERPAGLFALQTGYVKLYRQSKRKAQILAILVSGDCFGTESLVGEAPVPCTAQSITTTTAIHIPSEHLDQLIANCPDLLVLFVQLIAGRLRQLASLVHDLAFRDVAARLAAVLLLLAESDGTVTPAGILLPRILTQQEMAAMVGTAREVIHRMLKQFEQDGLVRATRTEIMILNRQQLASIAQQETR